MNKIQASALYSQFTGDKSPTVIDIRTQDAYGAGHIPGALNIPYLRLVDRPDFVPDGQPIVLYGEPDAQSNQEFQQAMRLLQDRGIEISELEGGLQAWVQAGYPLEIE